MNIADMLNKNRQGTKFYSRGYTSDQYNTPVWREKVKRVAKKLPALMDQLGAEAIVVTGKSGMSMAFSLRMLIDFDLVVVRKASDTHHGIAIEGLNGAKYQNYLILDDFVDSGETIKNVINSISDYSNGDMICLGVVCYDAEKYRTEEDDVYLVDGEEIKHYPV